MMFWCLRVNWIRIGMTTEDMTSSGAAYKYLLRSIIYPESAVYLRRMVYPNSLFYPRDTTFPFT